MASRAGAVVAVMGATGVAAVAAASPTHASGRHVFTRPLMGTEFRLVVHDADSVAASAAADRAFARIAELEAVLSDYDPASEVSRLSATAGEGRWVPVSADLWAVLSRAKEWADRSDGAFDPTVGSLTRLWRRAARRGSVPGPEAVEAALLPVGHRRLALAPDRRAVRLEAPGARLDLGGIAKGWAADVALELLAEAGFPRALVDAGGDVAAGAPPPGEEGWRVALPTASGAEEPDPAACVVRLARAALATSGATERSVEVDGVRHSHVLDPRTGTALTHGRVITVLAPRAADADALASALSVLHPANGGALLGGSPGAGARILEPDGDSRRIPPFPTCEPEHET